MNRTRRKRRRKGGCLTAVLTVCMGLVLAALLLSVFVLRDDDVRTRVRDVLSGREIPYPEGNVAEEELAQKYYYNQFSAEEKTVYRELLQGIREEREEIYIHAEDAERANSLFQYILKDYPELFWCSGNTTTTFYSGEEEYCVLRPEYLCDAQTREQRQQEIDAAAAECLAGISADASDYDKILYVYDYIVDTVEYDLSAEDNQNIYSVFVGKRSVCAGYSKAMQYLLERLGVFCTYVTGTADGNDAHAWNLVRCGEDYYYVDVTWGDPVFQASEGGEQWTDQISYDYMCCSSEELFRTHTPDGDVRLPECTKMDCNYYAVNGMYHTYYDSRETLGEMNDVIAAGGDMSVFKYSGADVYAQARADIFDNLIPQAAQRLADMYGLTEVTYRYIDDDRQNKIVIYWEYS